MSNYHRKSSIKDLNSSIEKSVTYQVLLFSVCILVHCAVNFPSKMTNIIFLVVACICALYLDEVAAFGEFYIAVENQNSEDITFAANLITPQYGLTDAERVYSLSTPESLRVIAGVTSPKKSDWQYGVVKRVNVHLGYNSSTQENNIALLLFSDPFKISEAVRLIPLGCRTKTYSVTTVVVDKISRSLYEEVPSEVIDNKECAKVYNQSGSTFICAVQSGGSNAIDSDNFGTGLKQKGKLIGVLIGVAGREFVDVPQLFTSIASVIDWLNEESEGALRC